MYRRLKDYTAKVEGLLKDPPPGVSWEDEIEDLLRQIAFFQHERLAHLLVTLAFALMVLACALVTIVATNLLTCVLMALLTVLLVPYVVHYYHLENGTQALYRLFDRMAELRDAQHG